VNNTNLHPIPHRFPVAAQYLSPILVPIKSAYATKLVSNTNLHRISHCFQVITDYWSDFRCLQGGSLLNIHPCLG